MSVINTSEEFFYRETSFKCFLLFCCCFSLLDVLAGRTELEGIDGHILVDSAKPPKNFKCMTGYVVQVNMSY